MRYDIESCNQGGEDQDMTWLDGPVTSMKGKWWLRSEGPRVMVKLEEDLAPMDRCNGEEHW
jgi:hypothetical protein